MELITRYLLILGVSASLSSVCTICLLSLIVYEWLATKQKISTITISIICLCTTDLGATLTTSIGAWLQLSDKWELKASSSCTVHGFAVQIFYFGSILWCSFIATYNFARIVFPMQIKRIPEVPIWLTPVVIFAIDLLLAISVTAIGHMGPAGVWCWIEADHVASRFGFFYGWLYALTLVVFTMYIAIFVKVYYSEKRLTEDSVKRSSNVSKVLSRSLLFPLVFVLLWIPGMTVRTMQSIPVQVPTGWFYVQMYIVGALGFWNAVCYGCTNPSVRHRVSHLLISVRTDTHSEKTGETGNSRRSRVSSKVTAAQYQVDDNETELQTVDGGVP